MYEDLESLANLKFGRAVEEISKELEDKQQEIIENLANRGLIQSGPMENAIVQYHVKRSEQICRALAEIWTELILA